MANDQRRESYMCVYWQQYLASAEQDGFGFVTLLRLFGWFAKDGVSDSVPERVAFQGACVGIRAAEDKCGTSPGTDGKLG